MTSQSPWYKQFWPWFLIFLPSCAVVAGIATVIIASNNKVELVADDYYKSGKAIKADNSKLEKAQALAIEALLSPLTNKQELILHLKSKQGDITQAIQLDLHHPTLSQYDITHILTSDASSQYHLPQPSLPPTIQSSDWLLHISPMDSSWRLQQRIQLPTKQTIRISAITP